MAKAYQCDRCMQYYTANKDVLVPGKSTDAIASGIAIESSAMPCAKGYELCDKCLGELVDWLEFRTITKN